ncbi:sugar ABC transporter permease [Streptomyces sp. 549]|uniref:sugar ABC transporter permease n=1 Tax=Streptomyces sp. 549 TaxID=3049076 RepID=UPI0024C36B5F|nr:sugar ABC transporter permease [Streptomyces sp. 549]MDK1473157.1 sugar ABC transporter permease [Streptomyces sp. 549]
MNAASAAWADEALGRVLDRVAVTRSEVGPRFPLYADPVTGRWTSTRRGSWTGGFWAGLLCLRARRTGHADDRDAAAACTRALTGWADADTATRGLILWYGTALAGRGDPDAAELRVRGARSCLAAFDPALGLVPWGDAFGGDRAQARTDGLPGMLQLLSAAGEKGLTAAAAHLDRHLRLCLPADPADPVRPAWHQHAQTPDAHTSTAPPVPRGEARDGEAREGAAREGAAREGAAARHAGSWRPSAEPAPGWSRGEAWLVLAVGDALTHPQAGCARGDAVAPGGRSRHEELARAAGRLADGLLTGPLVPPARAAHPPGPVDTSAAAIGAVALLKLAGAPLPDAARYRERAVAVLHRLTTAHLTPTAAPPPPAASRVRPAEPVAAAQPVPPVPPAGGGRPAGMLLDGCYDADRGLATRHELVWGDFFLALGLAALTGLVDLREV